MGETDQRGETFGYEVKEEGKNTWLTKVGFYIIEDTALMIDNIKFRVNIYDMSQVKSSPTSKFINVLDQPLYFTYHKKDVNDSKFIYELPIAQLLPEEAMVEIEILDDFGDKYLFFKCNLLGGKVWYRTLNDKYWDKCNLSSPFFIECETFNKPKD